MRHAVGVGRMVRAVVGVQAAKRKALHLERAEVRSARGRAGGRDLARSFGGVVR